MARAIRTFIPSRWTIYTNMEATPLLDCAQTMRHHHLTAPILFVLTIVQRKVKAWELCSIVIELHREEGASFTRTCALKRGAILTIPAIALLRYWNKGWFLMGICGRSFGELISVGSMYSKRADCSTRQLLILLVESEGRTVFEAEASYGFISARNLDYQW